MSDTGGWIDCGCCAGVEWGGDYPRECDRCGGAGRIWRYPSGVLAWWYGGPLCGRDVPVSAGSDGEDRPDE